MNRKVIIIGLSTVSAGVIFYFIMRAIQRTGIIKRLDLAYKNPNSQDAAGGFDKLLASEAFDTTRYQTSGKATITLMQARDRAKKIWDAYSRFFSSDQTSILDAFDGLGHFDDVSKISHEFTESYEYDLLEVLKAAITDKSKISMLVAHISGLPKN